MKKMTLPKACEILGFDKKYRSISRAMEYNGSRIVALDNCRCGSDIIYARYQNRYGHNEWHSVVHDDISKIKAALRFYEDEVESCSLIP